MSDYKAAKQAAWEQYKRQLARKVFLDQHQTGETMTFNAAQEKQAAATLYAKRLAEIESKERGEHPPVMEIRLNVSYNTTEESTKIGPLVATVLTAKVKELRELNQSIPADFAVFISNRIGDTAFYCTKILVPKALMDSTEILQQMYDDTESVYYHTCEKCREGVLDGRRNEERYEQESKS